MSFDLYQSSVIDPVAVLTHVSTEYLADGEYDIVIPVAANKRLLLHQCLFFLELNGSGRQVLAFESGIIMIFSGEDNDMISIDFGDAGFRGYNLGDDLRLTTTSVSATVTCTITYELLDG